MGHFRAWVYLERLQINRTRNVPLGVSLGNGRAVGCNNTGQGRVTHENDGTDGYGVFKCFGLCDILEPTEKYRGINRKVEEDVEGKVKAASGDSPKPRGSFIVVCKYSPLAGGLEGIYC